MNFNTAFAAVWLCLAISCTSNPPQNLQNLKAHHEVSQSGNQLDQLGQYTNFVPLESPEAALLGSISLVRQATNGDWLIGDFRSSLKIYRFNSEGRFLLSYGNKGLGPGEWEHITGFDLFSNGDLLAICPNKLVRFAEGGEVVDEVPLSYFADEGLIIKDRVYLRIASSSMLRVNSGIAVLDEQLSPVMNLHRAEPRLQMLSYLPQASIAKSGDRLFVSEIYDYAFSIYQADGNPIASYRFASLNPELDKVWPESLQKMTQDHKDQIIAGTHRAQQIFALQNGVFMFESNMDSRRYWPVWFDLDSNTLTKFPELKLFQSEDNSHMPISQVVGSYDRGLIAIIDDPAVFARYQARYPQIADHVFSINDNPILVQLELTPQLQNKHQEPAS